MSNKYFYRKIVPEKSELCQNTAIFLTSMHRYNGMFMITVLKRLIQQSLNCVRNVALSFLRIFSKFLSITTSLVVNTVITH